MKVSIKNQLLLAFFAVTILLLSFSLPPKIEFENANISKNIVNAKAFNTESITGCLIFKTSYSHFKSLSNIPLTLKDYKALMRLRKGKLAIEKRYGERMFTKKIAISKRIERSDTATLEYKRIDAILKKYE